LVNALQRCAPREVYNLASVSFVPTSWDRPILTAQFAALGVTSLLEAIRHVDDSIRFYQASSSEIFGEPLEAPQTASRTFRSGGLAQASRPIPNEDYFDWITLPESVTEAEESFTTSSSEPAGANRSLGAQPAAVWRPGRGPGLPRLPRRLSSAMTRVQLPLPAASSC
jgi:nucleoside-diphosphate-sugar epimerase